MCSKWVNKYVLTKNFKGHCLKKKKTEKNIRRRSLHFPWTTPKTAVQKVKTVAALRLLVCTVFLCSLRYQMWRRRAAQSQTGYDEVLAFAAVSLRHVKVRSPWHCLTSRPPRWPAVTHLPGAQGNARHLITAHMGCVPGNNAPFNLLNDYNYEKARGSVGASAAAAAPVFHLVLFCFVFFFAVGLRVY